MWHPKKNRLGPITTKKPESRVLNYLLPHSVLEGRSKKAGLGSSSNPKNCTHILKQKEEASHLAI
jgi:hypothetical protein